MLLAPALHVAFILFLIALHEIPSPHLYLEVSGDGKATLTVDVDAEVRCTDECKTDVARDTRVTVRALLDEDSELESWEGCLPNPDWGEECVVDVSERVIRLKLN